MKIKIIGRKINVTDGLKGYVEKKLSKLDKFFPDSAQADVTLSVQKDDQIVEITVANDGIYYRAEVPTRDMYASIDKSVDLLERQIRKQKTRLEKRLKTGAFSNDAGQDIPDFEPEGNFEIVKVKRYKGKPMNAEEAILQMNLVGHSFYIFSNSENMKANVVYKRKDGNYGLIELE